DPEAMEKIVPSRHACVAPVNRATMPRRASHLVPGPRVTRSNLAPAGSTTREPEIGLSGAHQTAPHASSRNAWGHAHFQPPCQPRSDNGHCVKYGAPPSSSADPRAIRGSMGPSSPADVRYEWGGGGPTVYFRPDNSRRPDPGACRVFDRVAVS